MAKYNGREMHVSKPWNPTILNQAQSNKAKYVMADVPILGDMIRASDSYRYTNDYLKHRNISWADVKYPAIQRGAGMTSGVSSPFISASFHYLYGRPSNNYVTGKNSRYPPIGYR